jgi:hypothetical protein
MHIWNLLVSLDIDMIIILVDPLPPTPLHLPAKKNQKRYREAMHACEPSISPNHQLEGGNA